MSEISCFFDVNNAKLNFLLSMYTDIPFNTFNAEIVRHLSDYDVSVTPRYSYVDEDGDRVYFESDLEIKEALSYGASQELFIVFVEVPEKNSNPASTAAQQAPLPQSIPQYIPESFPDSIPPIVNDISNFVGAIGEVLKKDLPQIANAIENVIGENGDNFSKFLSEIVEEAASVKCAAKPKVSRKCSRKNMKKAAKKCEKVEKVVHNAICDYCSKHIDGIRYKCLQCPDYDLCEDCEVVNVRNKFHDDSHIFAKIYKPLRAPLVPHPHFAARMGPCPGQRFERVRNLENKVSSLESQLAEIRALLANNNNNNNNVEISSVPLEMPQAIPNSIVEPAELPLELPQENNDEEAKVDDDTLENLTEEEKKVYTLLKQLGFDVHSSVITENNADLHVILEKICF